MPDLRERKICRGCYDGRHPCNGHSAGSSTCCECPCRGLSGIYPEVATVLEWRRLIEKEAGIRADMKALEMIVK